MADSDICPNGELEQAQQLVIGRILTSFWESQDKWSQETFGTDRMVGPTKPLKHLIKEAGEALADVARTEQATSKLEQISYRLDAHTEIADCFILVVDAARRAGLNLFHLLKIVEQKHELNKKREWPKLGTVPNDEPTEHVR